jgi:hypothetical protein
MWGVSGVRVRDFFLSHLFSLVSKLSGYRHTGGGLRATRHTKHELPELGTLKTRLRPESVLGFFFY